MTHAGTESPIVINAIIQVYEAGKTQAKTAHYEDSAQALIHFSNMNPDFKVRTIEIWLAKPEMKLHARKTYELFLENVA